MNPNPKATILIVDDNPANLQLLSDFLTNHNYEVLTAKTGQNALKKLQNITPSIILLDVIMPGMDGFTTCRHLKAKPQTQGIPVIFLSACSDNVDKVTGLNLGAVDYITKPIQPAEVLARIQIHLQLHSANQQLKIQNQLLQQEITTRKKTEQRLKLLERAIAASKNGVVISDAQKPEMPLIYVNSGYEQIAGCSAEEVVGKGCPIIATPNSEQPALIPLKQAVREGQESHALLSYKSPDGSQLWHELNVSPVHDAQGNLTHYIGIHTDVTELKKVENKLCLANERLAYLLTSSPAIIYSRQATKKHQTTWISDNVSSVIGYQAKDFLESPEFWLEHIHPKDIKGVKQAMGNLWEKGYSCHEYRFGHQDGSYRWIRDEAKLIYDHSDNPLEIIGCWLEISQRKRVELEITEAKIALEKQMQRALLLEHITHNIRSSLNQKQILQTAANLIGNLFMVSRCVIYTYSCTTKSSLPCVAQYRQPEVDSILHCEIPVQGNPHAKLVLTQDRAVVSTDVNQEPLLEGISDLCEQMEIKSMAVVRTSYRGQANGVIAIHQCDRIREWSSEEIDLLEAVANKMGIAIAQSHLLQQEQQRRQQLETEIEERQKAQKALQASEAQLRGIFTAMTDLVVVRDIEGRCLKVAPTGTGNFLCSPEEMLGKTLHQILPKNIADLLFQRLQDTLATQETTSVEYNLMIGERKVWLDAKLSPLSPESVIIVARDISDRKKVEIALQEAKEAAEAANRAKSHFLSSMSHELRTPLNSILGFSQIMARDTTLKKEHREYIDIINRSGEYLLNLINDILSMSKIEAGRTSLNSNIFDLHGLLNDLVTMLQFKAQNQSLELKLITDPELPRYINSDAGKLRQVLINLLGNAIKFTKVGKVTLRVGLNLKTNILQKQSQNSNQLLYFQVSDTGSGIAPEELDTLFEPFVQTETGRQAMQGTGLGLAICKQFVKLMGGEIAVQSTWGEGSTFSFSLPSKVIPEYQVEQLEDSPQRRIIGLAPNQPQYRVLVVEDVAVNRKLLNRILQPLGFEVREAINGQEALALWSNWQPHLIFMDMLMPVMDGYMATQKIKQSIQGKNTVVIALTASTFEEQRGEILAVGCDDFIGKPFQESVLLDKIAQHLQLRYLYEEMTTGIVSKDLDVHHVCGSLDPEYLQVMPPEWVEKLHQAVLRLNNRQIMDLIQQIPPHEANFAYKLRNLVNNFRLDLILNLTQTWVDNRQQSHSTKS